MSSPLAKRASLPVGLFVLLAGLSCAFAGQELFVRIPFDFRVGKTHFGPGAYVLAMDRVSTGSVTIQSADRKRGAFVHTIKSTATERVTTPTISFRAYGDSRFLSAIQSGSAGERWDLTPTPDEAGLTRTQGQPRITSLKAEIFEKK